MMREQNRHSFVRVVCGEVGIALAGHFSFAASAAGAVAALGRQDLGEVDHVFQAVGGIDKLSALRLTAFVKALRSDDCLAIDGEPFVVEYDEALHLTPFRQTTLNAPLYSKLRIGFDLKAYRSICGTIRMPTASKRAHVEPKNPRPNSTTPHLNFTCPTKPGECRHRQRAFYDFLKDVLLGSGNTSVPRLIRISDLTDFVNGSSPSVVLENGTPTEKHALAALLRARANLAAYPTPTASPPPI
jgi:hypothetical protein